MYAHSSVSEANAGAVRGSGLKTALRRHPISSYFLLAYAGTWLTLLPAFLSKDGIGVLPFSMPFAVFAVLFVMSGLAGPTLAALVMTGVTEGKSGVRAFLRRYRIWQVGMQWWLAVLFGYVGVYLLIAVAALGGAPLTAFAQKWPLIFASYLPAVLTFNLVTAFGEEPGWRGYALPRLQEKYGPVVGSLILGTLHAGWHLPVFFLPALGLGPLSLPKVLVWVPTVWATTVLWTWVFNNTKGSILMAILLHSAFDAAGSLVFYQILNASKLSTAAQHSINMWQTVLFIGMALIVIAATRGRLSYRGRRESAVAAPEAALVAAH